MRIAIVTSCSRKVGGAEAYVDRVIGAIQASGYEVALLSEFDTPAERPPIRIPRASEAWTASTSGWRAALRALRNWRPHLIYSQGLQDPFKEAQTIELAPAVLFAHSYSGCCISGTKSYAFPHPKACSRRFGAECLAHFYPRRCGGLNPLTAWNQFRRESRKLEVMRSYEAIVTPSEHMRSEFLRHGFKPDAITVISCPADGPNSPELSCGDQMLRETGDGLRPYRLLFLGRMEPLKGGMMLLEALPRVLNSIGAPISLTFVGEGRDRDKLERKANYLRSNHTRLQITFTGWLEGEQLRRQYRDADLLVVPSLWPEPFGLVGPEAGLESLPAVAFAVGGIPEWLFDGVNGCLAPGNPPTSGGLAQVIVKCLSNSGTYAQLRAGALKVAQRFNLRNHIKLLLQVFDRVAEPAEESQGTPLMPRIRRYSTRSVYTEKVEV